MISSDALTGAILDNVGRVLAGKRAVAELALSALLANGHILLEDVPGVGKTALARALAISTGATFTRVQFTPDLLPGDVTGTGVYNPDTRQFEFRPGPIVTQVLLADEINRATPKTQSALLEAMDERKVTVDGVTHLLPAPFLVLATQNPLEFEGTFPLPESQLDRFLISLTIGYPTREAERTMLSVQERSHPLDTLMPVCAVADLLDLQTRVLDVYVDPVVREYILDLVETTRHHGNVHLGASPRATLGLFRMSQARALLAGRDYTLPDDVKAVAIAVLRHRIVTEDEASPVRFVRSILDHLPVPANRGYGA
ncbi:MAG TPA: AAA family ATPase [Chloroflexota bacterium]|nr:AAA family ATPase [Chloroflexota bacterium]